MSKETELSDEQIHTALDSVDPEFWDVPMDGTLQFARAIIAADRELRRGDAQMPEPVASVYTMDALVPGGGVRHHVTLHKPLPAGTKFYTAAQVQAMLAAHVPVAAFDRLQSLADSQAAQLLAFDDALEPPVAQPSSAAVERKQDEALIRQLVDALENHPGNYKLTKAECVPVDNAITAAHARLELMRLLSALESWALSRGATP